MPEIEIICQLLSNQHSDYVRHQIQQDLIHIFKYFVEITHCFYMPHRERERDLYAGALALFELFSVS